VLRSFCRSPSVRLTGGTVVQCIGPPRTGGTVVEPNAPVRYKLIEKIAGKNEDRMIMCVSISILPFLCNQLNACYRVLL